MPTMVISASFGATRTTILKPSIMQLHMSPILSHFADRYGPVYESGFQMHQFGILTLKLLAPQLPTNLPLLPSENCISNTVERRMVSPVKRISVKRFKPRLNISTPKQMGILRFDAL